MKFLSKNVLALAAFCLAAALGVAGCSSPISPGAVDGTGTPTDAPTGTSTSGSAADAWDACPAIVDSLNGNADDPSDYEQLDASGFGIQEVGSDVLERACIIGVTIGGETLTWAILPGNASLAESIRADLLDAGFITSSDLPGMVGNTTTGQGALIAAFDSGAELDKYLVYPTAFTPYDEELVYIGTFTLS